MERLIFAEFKRLFKNILFNAGLLFSAIVPIWSITAEFINQRLHPEDYFRYTADDLSANRFLFENYLWLPLLMAVWMCIFIGDEYHNSTLRNKLDIGNSRISVYFSKLIVCIIGNMGILLLNFAAAYGMGSHLLGITRTWDEILPVLESGMIATVALTAIFLFITMTAQSRSIGSVIGLTVVVLMIAITQSMKGDLANEKFVPYYIGQNPDGTSIYDERLNPLYIGDRLYGILDFLDRSLPTSQMNGYAATMKPQSIDMHFCSTAGAVISVVFTFFGIAIFSKANLK